MVTWLQFPSNANVTYNVYIRRKQRASRNKLDKNNNKPDPHFSPTSVVNYFEPNPFFGYKLEFLVGRQLVLIFVRSPWTGSGVGAPSEEFFPPFPLESLLFFFGSLEFGSWG